jgi:hypothetical protein
MDGPWKRARLVLAPSGSKNEEVSIRARDMTVWTFWPAAMRQRIACRGFFRCRFLRLGPKSSIAAAGRARHLPDAIPAVVHRNIDLAREHPKRGFADQFFTREILSQFGKFAAGRMSEQRTTEIPRKSSAPLIKPDCMALQGKSGEVRHISRSATVRGWRLARIACESGIKAVKFQLTTCP